jgi:hypothetical protein
LFHRKLQTSKPTPIQLVHRRPYGGDPAATQGLIQSPHFVLKSGSVNDNRLVQVDPQGGSRRWVKTLKAIHNHQNTTPMSCFPGCQHGQSLRSTARLARQPLDQRTAREPPSRQQLIQRRTTTAEWPLVARLPGTFQTTNTLLQSSDCVSRSTHGHSVHLYRTFVNQNMKFLFR